MLWGIIEKLCVQLNIFHANFKKASHSDVLKMFRNSALAFFVISILGKIKVNVYDKIN